MCYSCETGGTDTMTRPRHGHRVLHDLPADEFRTPGTFDPYIALAQLLAVRAECVGVLAQLSALLPYPSCSLQPGGIPLPQLMAQHQLGTGQRSRGVRIHV
jgi:hypothetical protein